MKIINPTKKSEVIAREIHHFSSKFESVNALRSKLVNDFVENIPSSEDFTVGYYDGSQHSKMWLVTADDLHSMYTKYPKGGNIVLWCDGKSSETPGKRKRKSDGYSISRQDREDDVQSIYEELKELHSSEYDVPRLRLWARMIASEIHDDYDNPPNIPAFSPPAPKKPRKESMCEAMTGAAVAIVNAIRDPSSLSPSSSSTKGLGISPRKSVELRMKNYEQLRYLQKLFDDGILNTKEYEEQKQSIIDSLRKLS